MAEEVTARFWSKVNRSGPFSREAGSCCWVWIPKPRPDGYGQFWIGGSQQMILSHRLSYDLETKSCPPQLDHICRNRRCVRPSHLRPATHQQNSENSGAKKNSTSGVRGVYWHSATGRWLAQVSVHGHRTTLGYFTTIGEAEAAVVAKRCELFTHNDLDRAS